MGKTHVNLSHLMLKYSDHLKISAFCKRTRLNYNTIIAIIRGKREFKENVAAKLRQEIYIFWLNLGKDFGFFERWRQETPAQQDSH